jgi:hypothetical protein
MFTWKSLLLYLFIFLFGFHIGFTIFNDRALQKVGHIDSLFAWVYTKANTAMRASDECVEELKLCQQIKTGQAL